MTATETETTETRTTGTGARVAVRRAAESALHTVYAWERWGNFINASPGDDVEIPYDAAFLQVKLYPFPAGEIRVLRFHPKVRTHVHVNKTDTILYEWTTRRIQFVDDDAAICDPGHFSLHPKGVFHHGTVLTPGLTVEFAMEATAAPNPVPTFVAGAGVPLVPDGDAQVRSVALGRYVAREVHLPAGAEVTERHAGADRLLVVLDGELGLTGSGATHEMGVEDTGYAAAGETVTLTARTAVVLLDALLPN